MTTSSLPLDPYKALGVSKDAQIPEIRSAHRKLVLKCHPDKVQDPELKAQKQDEFQRVQQAYEMLSDDKERQKYDDNAKLAELRKQMQNKANISSPRSSPRYAGEYEIRTAEPRPSTFKTGSPHAPPGGKVYTYSRSWEDEHGRGPRIFETEIRTSSRREPNYAEKPSKREAEREREREREMREREKEKERERRRRAEEEARREEKAAEKAAKEARRAEKKMREKQRDKALKRAAEEKARHRSPYIESYEEDVPMPKDKKKSSSRKYEEKRERSSHREEIPTSSPPPMPHDREAFNLGAAASYIARSKQGVPNLQRSATTYHVHNMAPPAPTPPPAQGSPFATPGGDDDDARRSSAKARRGSSDTIKSARSHKKSSREFDDDPVILEASPSARHAAQFQKSATTSPRLSTSPPRRDLPRTNTMPADANYPRPGPGMTRASTFSYGENGDPRGRSRSRMQPQIEEESESDEEYERERRRRERKQRGGKKTRSPEPQHRPENVVRSTYHVDGGRSKLSSYSRHLEPDSGAYYYDARPSMPRDGSYKSGSGSTPFPKVRTTPSYGYDDVQYSSHYGQPHCREDYAAAYA